MISMLTERATVYGLLAAICFGAGWKVQGWRLGAQMAQVEAGISAERTDAMRLLIAEQEASAAEMSEADEKYTGELNDAKGKIADLERRVANGSSGLRVAASCPPAKPLPEAGTAAGVGAGNGESNELNADARPDYYALRRGILELEAALKVCVDGR